MLSFETEYIYVLLLLNGKYYVGRSKDVEKRFEQHKVSTNEWLHTNRPIKIVELKEAVGLFDEDNKTKAYMYTHGIDNVRGGTYTTYILPLYVKNLLEKELVHAFGLCFRCKLAGHCASLCTLASPSNSPRNE